MAPAERKIEIRSTLRCERIRLRMSQKEVAERLGCSRKCVSEFETGLTSPSFGFVVAYVDLVGARLVYTGPEGDHLDFV